MDEALLFNYITDPLLDFTLSSQRFKLLLKAPEDHQILNGKLDRSTDITNIFQTITGKFGDSTTSHVGVLLLDTFLPQCYDEIFAKNGISWMHHCISILRNPSETDVVIADTLKVLKTLFELSGKFAHMRMAMCRVVQPFLNVVETTYAKPPTIRILRCLKPLVMYYPTTCQQFNGNFIHNFLLDTIDCQDSTLAFCAGQCMCYLAQGVKPLPHKRLKGTNNQAEGDMLSKIRNLCGTANEQLAFLFAELIEVGLPRTITALARGFKLKPLDGQTEGDMTLKYEAYARRFVNVLSAIEGMLMCDSGCLKNVNIPEIVSVAFRALNIDSFNIGYSKGTVEHLALMTVLPQIHVSAFNFLSSLVTRCVRKAAYLFLETWAVRAKAACCVEVHAEELFRLLLPDIVQKEKTVTLQDQKTSNAGQEVLTKKLLLNPQANSEVCAAALRALCAVIEASGSVLRVHHHVMLQEAVVGLLLEVRCNNLEYMPVPFSSPECRLQLYRVLLALTVHPQGSWPAPLQFALTLFPYGQCDPSLEVSSFCLLATATVRQMVHPSRSNTQFPISVEDFRVSAGLEEKPLCYYTLTPDETESINANVSKRKLTTPPSNSSLNGTKEDTPVSSSAKKAKKSTSPAVKRKKMAPVLDASVNELGKDIAPDNQNTPVLSSDKKALKISSPATKKKKGTPVSDANVNGLGKEIDLNVAQKKENTPVLGSDKKAVKNSSPAAKKKKLTPVLGVSVNGLEKDFNSVVQKKKPKRSLEKIRADPVTPSSSERPLKKKRRSFSESSVGSLDLSAGRNSLRLSVDSWEVLELPQKEKKKKKKKEKQKGQKKKLVDEGSVEVERPIRKGERVCAVETRSVKTPLSSNNSWNVTDSPGKIVSPKKSPVKIVSPSAETVSAAQKKSVESLEKGRNSLDEVPVQSDVKRRDQPLPDDQRGKCIVTEEQAGGVRSGKTESTRERSGVTVAEREEEEKTASQHVPKEKKAAPNQTPSKDTSTSQSQTPEVSSVAGHLSTHEKEKAPESKSLSPAKDTKTASEGVNKISDVVGTVKNVFQGDKSPTSIKDSSTTTESGINEDGDQGTTSYRGEKSPGDEPSTPVKESKSVSDDNGSISDTTITIEEIPNQGVGSAEKKPRDTSAGKDSSSSSTPIVDLADSDNSCSVISLDGQENEVVLDARERAVSASFEESQDPDASTGMDAVEEEAPCISLEEAETTERAASGRNKEKQEGDLGKDSTKGSETDEEEILTTFVDIVSTDSK